MKIYSLFNMAVVGMAVLAGFAVNAFAQVAPVQEDKVQIGGVAQFRYTYSSGDNDAYGFSVPRTRVDFTGNLGDGVSYRVSPLINSESEVELQDAYANFDFTTFGMQVGQFRPQFMNELNVDDEQILGVERSVVSNTLGQTYTQGVQGSFDLGRVSAFVSFNDGRDMANTDVVPANNGYGVTGRLNWEVYKTENSTVAIGGGFSHEDDSDTFVGDVSWAWKSLDTSLAFAYADSEWNQYNAVVGTVAYRCDEYWQPYLRHEWGTSDSSQDLNITTLGVNYFVAENAVVWSNEVGYAWDGVSSDWNTENTGWAVNGEDGDFVVRSQLTVRF